MSFFPFFFLLKASRCIYISRFVWGEKAGWGVEHTLIVVQDVPLVISTAIVSFSDGHGVVGEVDIAVVACVWSLAGDTARIGGGRDSYRRVHCGQQRSGEAVRKGVLIFRHVENGFPDLCEDRCAVGVVASNVGEALCTPN